MLRKLRIAFSVACGIVCLLLIALWVRSYLKCDIRTIVGCNCASLRGFIYLNEGITFENTDIVGGRPRQMKGTIVSAFRWMSLPQAIATPKGDGVRVPHWVVLIALTAISAATTRRWRFSLRTMLIATALVAVLLGAIVYAVK